MQELSFRSAKNVVPLAIQIDKEELKRLKAYKLISLDLYIWWGLTLQFGSGTTELDNDQMTRFCEKWSFNYGDYTEGLTSKFTFIPQDVLIAIGKLAKKEGSGVKVSLQLSLDLGALNE